MAAASDTIRKIPVTALVIGAIAVVFLVAGITYLNRPVSTTATAAASAEAKAYLPNLELSDVSMQATLNFMQQQVVEVQGKIANHGPRKLALIEVYCLFFGADGREVHREKVAVVRNLNPGETRSFRLPFDALPDAWNQAMPRLAIARIAFSG